MITYPVYIFKPNPQLNRTNYLFTITPMGKTYSTHLSLSKHYLLISEQMLSLSNILVTVFIKTKITRIPLIKSHLLNQMITL